MRLYGVSFDFCPHWGKSQFSMVSPLWLLLLPFLLALLAAFHRFFFKLGKGIYYFVPKMIKYYLGEEPVLKNAPTYLPFYDDMKYVMEHLDTLVIKDVAEAGGYGVVFGSDLTKEKLEEFRKMIIAEPRRFIAQEVIDFLDLPILENGETVMRNDPPSVK